jgi:putative flippase GtrA
MPIEKAPLLDAPREAPPAYPGFSLRIWLIEPSENTFVQFARYIVTGGVAFTADFGTLFLLTRYGGVHYLISAAVGFTVGLLINYVISSTWVFAHRTVQNRGVEFGIFAAIGLVGLGLNELGMWLLATRVGIYYLWAKLITTAVVYIWNFGARKVALFR